MPRSPSALVEPHLLVWARESARLNVEEAAGRVRVASERLVAWEEGTERPSITQLRKLSALYRRPLAVFFLSAPPVDFDAIRDFRRVSAEEELVVSEKLHSELKRAGGLRDAAITLLEAREVPPFPISASASEDPEVIGEQLRTSLGVAPRDQLSWRDPYEALRGWRAAAEELGVVVINMRGVEVDEARGFSIAEAPVPLVALNSQDSPNGRIFTLLHELAHVALHEGGICEWTLEQSLTSANRQIETFCNAVAAATLLPRELVLQVVGEPRFRIDWPDEGLRRFARTLRVSEEALVRRFVTLGLTSMAFYLKKRSEYLQAYAEAAKRPSKIVVPYEKRIVGALGGAYLDLAFAAYYERRITLSELSSYTGVRVNNLSKVEREAFGISRVPGGAS